MKTYLNVIFLCLLVFTGCSKQEGCTDASACNFDELAEIDNGTCEFAETNYDCAGGCLNDSDNDGLCDENESYIFTLCEGNFQTDNSSLWYFDNNENVLEPENNPIGDIGQSMFVDGNVLYVILNGSGLIHVYEIAPSGIQFNRTINLDFSGPRYMEVNNGFGFITEWNTNQIRVIDLTTDETVSSISVAGMPEQIILHDNYFYVSIIMNSDWTASEKVLKINPNTFTIEAEFSTAPNPSDLEIIDGQLYVSSTYYDSDWNTYYAMTKIDLANGESIIFNDDSGIGFKEDIFNVNGELFRATNSGIIQLDLNNLDAISGTEIGNYSDVYSVEFIDNQFYIGRTDYVAPDNVDILDLSGNLINSYSVGAIPGSFTIWNNE